MVKIESKKLRIVTPRFKLQRLENPGRGDCAFFSFALGLIYVIQNEFKEHSDTLFQKWLALDPKLIRNTNKFYKKIQAFNFDSMDKKFLSKIQKHLRHQLYRFKINELHDICKKFLQNEDFNQLNSSNIYNDFAELYYEKNIHLGNHNSNFGFWSKTSACNHFHRSNEIIKKVKKLVLPSMDSNAEQRQLALRFIELFYGTESLKSELEIPKSSPVVDALKIIKRHSSNGNDCYWGTEIDLRDLTEIFGLNCQFYKNNSNIYNHSQPDNKTLIFNNEQNIHWSTLIISKSNPPKMDVDNRLVTLQELINAVTEEYCEYNRKVWFSLFHRHGRKGRLRAKKFQKEINQFQSFNDAFEYLEAFLHDPKNGNLHPHSFRFMLNNANYSRIFSTELNSESFEKIATISS